MARQKAARRGGHSRARWRPRTHGGRSGGGGRAIGYPVVLKAQAAALSHKTEAGGVALNLVEEAALRAAWDVMMRSVKRAAPDISIEGALVEKMSPGASS